MQIVTVPCLSDNYAYLIICADGEAAVVDPSETEPVQQAIQREGVRLVAILNTHHHWDHTGGNEGLLQAQPDLEVYGHASDWGRIPGQTVALKSGDTLSIGRLQGTFTHNPGHTRGAVSYYFEDTVFTGDTLFAAGCGRLFEGTPAEMYRSLNDVIGAHPPATRVYFGHEYTLKNLQFALSLEPDNQHIQQRLQQVEALRRAGQGTAPSTLELEKAVNPFMRCGSEAMQCAARQAEPDNDLHPVSVLRVLRMLKDRF